MSENENTTKLSRRQYLRCLAFTAAGAVLAGCGASSPTVAPASAPTATPATPAPKAPTTAPGMTEPVELHWWMGSWYVPYAQKMLEKYAKDHSNVTLVAEEMAFDSYFQKVNTALNGGESVDMVDLTYSWLAPMAGQNLLTALDGHISELNKDDFYPGAWDSATNNGNLFGVPYRWDTMGLIFNRDMFKAAGLDPAKPPKSWAEFTDYAKKLTTADQYGTGLSGLANDNTLSMIVPVIWTNGGEIFDKDFKKTLVNQPAAVEALSWYADLWLKEKVVQKSLLNDDIENVEELFEAKKVAMHWTGSYVFTTLEKNAPDLDYGTAMVPGKSADKAATTQASGWLTAIPKTSKNADAAWDFLKFCTSTDVMAENARTTPARKSAAASSLFTASRKMDKLQPFIDQLQYARSEPPIAQWPQLGEVLVRAWQEILTAKKAPQAALDDAAAEMDKILAQA